MRETAKAQGFKTLVATSLALTLDVSMTSAFTLQGLTNNDTSNADLTINRGTATTDMTIQTSDGYNTLMHNSMSISNLRFWLGSPSGSSGTANYNVNGDGLMSSKSTTLIPRFHQIQMV